MTMKGAIIGSTHIAESHINAFSKNGLQIDSIASSQNSKSCLLYTSDAADEP